MERKNTLLLTVIAVATLLVAVVGATFAYFTATSNEGGRSRLTVNTNSVDQTTATGTDVALTINQSDMNLLDGKNDYTAYKENNAGRAGLETTVGNGGGINTCTYDLIYTPDADPSGVYTKSATNLADLKEFTVLVSATSSNGTITKETQTEIDLTGQTGIVNLVTGATLVVSGANETGSVTWTITPRYYNLEIDQTENAGKTFGGIVSLTNLSCNNVQE